MALKTFFRPAFLPNVGRKVTQLEEVSMKEGITVDEEQRKEMRGGAVG